MPTQAELPWVPSRILLKIAQNVPPWEK